MKPVTHYPLRRVGAAKHRDDAKCPDAGWKRLTNKQKARLSMLATKAAALQHISGAAEITGFRHEIALRACGLRISEATQKHWNDLKAAFQYEAGDSGGALNTQIRAADNKRRVALHKLKTACAERGLHESYPASICHTQYKCDLADASAKQLWCLFFTVTNRREKR